MFDPSTTLQSRAWVEVQLDHIRGNALAVQRAVGGATALLPMVKANAYGLGVGPVVHALTHVPELNGPWAFGVATVAEGEELRDLGWAGRVVVFSPAPPGELGRAAAARLTLCMSDLGLLRRWAGTGAELGRSLPFHLEVDTGMGRAGLAWNRVEQWVPEVLEAARAGASWEGCFTHFHSADEPDDAPTERQWERFQRTLYAIPEPVRGGLVIHAANSAAAMRWSGFGLNLVRPGIFLYGGKVGATEVPRSVVSVRARLVLVREVPPGATVGYGATYAASRGERWGTLAIGYGDGVPRALWTGGGEVLIRGRRVPIVGRVSMDMTTVDLTAVPEAETGDVATLIGRDGEEEITVDEVAARCGTISYEVLTGLTPRLPRVYLRGGEVARQPPAGEERTRALRAERSGGPSHG